MLSGSVEILLDAVDADLATLAWHTDKDGYIIRDSPRGTRPRRIYLHLEVAKRAGIKPAPLVDHVNGSVSDCRRANLRAATRSQNAQNMRKPKSNKSGHKGVCWAPREHKWRAYVTLARKQYSAGYYTLLTDAITARDELARRLHGSYWRST